MTTCPQITPVPCPQGDPSRCTERHMPQLGCDPMLPCDETIPPVVITDIEWDSNKQRLRITWEGAEATDHILMLVTFKADGNGPLYATNDIEGVADVDAPAVAHVMLGDQMNKGYQYLLSFRRVRGDAASAWTTIVWGLPRHKGAFSRGFSVDFN